MMRSKRQRENSLASRKGGKADVGRKAVAAHTTATKPPNRKATQRKAASKKKRASKAPTSKKSRASKLPTSKRRSNRRTGGSVASRGYTYQDRCGAFFAVSLLAARPAPFEWVSGALIESISLEVPGSLVDIVLRADVGGYAFVEAKSGLRLTAAPFTEVFEHFVTIYLTLTSRYERAFDIRRDRLVLTISQRCDERIRNDLTNVLLRFQTSAGRPPLSDAATSQNERTVFSRVINAIRRQWQKEIGSLPSDDDVVNLLSAIRVLQLDVGQRERKLRQSTFLPRSSGVELPNKLG